METFEETLNTPIGEEPKTRAELLAALAALDKAEGKTHLVPQAEIVSKDEPRKDGLMKTANVALALHKDQVVVISDVTPAHLQLLVIAFFGTAQGNPIKALTETDGVKRSSAQEVARLKGKYGPAKTNPLFGINSTLPETFHDAYIKGLAWASDNPQGLAEQPLVGRRLTPEEAAAGM